MFKLLFLISFCICLPSLYKTWDIAVATREEIELLSKEGELNTTVAAQLRGIRDITYDNYNGHIYISDSYHKKYSIFRVYAPSDSDSPSAKLQPVLIKQDNVIQKLTYDPIYSILLWTTMGNLRSVSWLKIPDGNDSASLPGNGNILHQFKTDMPYAIVVDSCRRFVFWTNIDSNTPSIDRSDIDGSNKTRIISKDLFMPYAITIDIQSKLIYWVDERELDSFRIEQSNLDGYGRKVVFSGQNNVPTSLSIGYDQLFYTDGTLNVWKLSLSLHNSTSLYTSYNKAVPQIVLTSDTKYDTYTNNNECIYKTRPPHKNLPEEVDDKNVKILNNGVRVISEEIEGEDNIVGALNCSRNGLLISDKCICKQGFYGKNCEHHLECHNYCVAGVCEIDVNGFPSCTCPSRYQGKRCQIDICQGKCLNGGTCTAVDTNQTHCECINGFLGPNCELHESLCETFCFLKNDIETYSVPELLSCRCDQYKDLTSRIHSKSHFNNVDLEHLVITTNDNSSSNGNGSFSSPSIMSMLGILCVLLIGLVVFLFTKVHKLSRRPKVLKKIILNKTTPLTSSRPPQPDQCEITIENCCNMNICETPCYEPEFRTPITKSKSKSDDKKTLLGDDMEDDVGGGASGFYSDS